MRLHPVAVLARQSAEPKLAALHRERDIQRAKAKERDPAAWLQRCYAPLRRS